jgi:hypothetical protein
VPQNAVVINLSSNKNEAPVIELVSNYAELPAAVKHRPQPRARHEWGQSEIKPQQNSLYKEIIMST